MGYRSEILADGPVLFWELDESSGTTFADTSPNGRDGSGSGTLAYQVSPTGVGESDGLGFGGDAQISAAITGGALAAGGDLPFTVEWWMQFTASGRERLWSLGNVRCEHWTASPAGLRIFFSTGSSPVTTLAYDFSQQTWNDGEWYYCALVHHGGGQYSFYRDGEIWSTGSGFSVNLPSNPVFTIGDAANPSASSSPFGGTLDEVALYDDDLIPGWFGDTSRLDAHWAARESLIAVAKNIDADGFVWDPANGYYEKIYDYWFAAAYWRLGEASGDAIDVAAYGNAADGTVAGTVERDVDGATADRDGALGLRGGDVSVVLDADAMAVPVEGWGFSVSCVFRTTQATGIVQLWDLAGVLWVEIEDGDLRISSGNGVDTALITTFSGGENVADGQWHQLVVTHDGFTDEPLITAFVDDRGVSAFGNGPSGADLPASGTYPMTLGTVSDPASASAAFPGDVDEFALFDYALFEEDVLDLYGQLQAPVTGGSPYVEITADGFVVTGDVQPTWWAGQPVVNLSGFDHSFLLWRSGQPVVSIPDLLAAGSILDISADGFVALDIHADGYVVLRNQVEITADGIVVGGACDILADGFVVDASTVRAFPRVPMIRATPAIPTERAAPALD